MGLAWIQLFTRKWVNFIYILSYSFLIRIFQLLFRGFYEILGIVVGHIYFYIKYKYPAANDGVQLFETPPILYRYLPSFSPVRTTGSTFNSFQMASSIRNRRTQNSEPSSGSSSGHNWGRGQVLGGR